MYRQRRIGVLRQHSTERQGVEEALIRAGYRVVRLHSPQQTLEVIDDGVMDGLVLDFIISEGTGLQLVTQLRARRSFLPVVLIVNAEDSYKADEARAAGIFEVLQTPLDVQRLLRVAACWFGPPHALEPYESGMDPRHWRM